MKILILALFFGLGLAVNSQEVKINEAVYKVKGGTILKDGIDVTEILSEAEKSEILTVLGEQNQLKADEELVEKLKKAEKDVKKAEKKQKRSEKALKIKIKAQSNFEKTGKKYEVAIKKYEKLKKKGELSPEDEGKWLNKIEKLKKTLEKATRNLK
jgi:hypothetical protein